MVLEGGSQEVCLSVLSGVLAPGIALLATLSTAPGNGM